MTENINKEHYNRQYKTDIELKYKTNTRYLLYLVDLLLQKIVLEAIKSVLDVGCGSGIIIAELACRMKVADIGGETCQRLELIMQKKSMVTSKICHSFAVTP